METYRDHKHARRAVAPIIATLLMVAIAVVGGILIFVFAQGFFTDTNIGTPTIESLEIFGFDASDKAKLRTHIHDPLATTDALQTPAAGYPTLNAAQTGALANVLGDNDAFTLFIRNKGSSPITIERVKVYGVEYTFDVATATGTAVGTGTPANPNQATGSLLFALSKDGRNAATSAAIEAGQEATLIIRYDDLINGKIKIGRPIPVVIQTGSGATFTKQLQNGVAAG